MSDTLWKKYLKMIAKKKVRWQQKDRLRNNDTQFTLYGKLERKKKVYWSIVFFFCISWHFSYLYLHLKCILISCKINTYLNEELRRYVIVQT